LIASVRAPKCYGLLADALTIPAEAWLEVCTHQRTRRVNAERVVAPEQANARRKGSVHLALHDSLHEARAVTHWLVREPWLAGSSQAARAGPVVRLAHAGRFDERMTAGVCARRTSLASERAQLRAPFFHPLTHVEPPVTVRSTLETIEMSAQNRTQIGVAV